MTKRTFVAIAAGTVFIATLSTVACKKEETTTPPDDATPTDEVDDAEDDEDAEEPADGPDEAEPLSKHSFDETINDHMSEVSDCYVKTLETSPDAKGKLEAEFTFGADGVPTSVVAAGGSTLTDEALLQCITDASKGWGFGPPKEAGMTLRYTFNLAPAG